MKTCPKCKGEFKNLGVHMRFCEVKNGMQERVQETEETKPTRPLDRWRNNLVFPGQIGVRRVNRGA